MLIVIGDSSSCLFLPVLANHIMCACCLYLRALHLNSTPDCPLGKLALRLFLQFSLFVRACTWHSTFARIQAIRGILNPEKLAYITRQLQARPRKWFYGERMSPTLDGGSHGRGTAINNGSVPSCIGGKLLRHVERATDEPEGDMRGFHCLLNHRQ